MQFGLGNLLRVFQLGVKDGQNTSTVSSVDALILILQQQGWRVSGIEDKVRDPAFPFSGHFDPPRLIEEDVARSLMLAGNVVDRPIIRPELLTTAYQDKLSPPFIYAAWYRLAGIDAFPENLNLGENVFLASAPTGKVYPVTYLEGVSKKFVIVFDANLILFYRVFLTSLATICYAPEADQAPDDPFWIKWGHNFTVERSLEEIVAHEEATINIATLLLNIVSQSLPYSDNLNRLEPAHKKGLLIALITDDLFTYLIGHEVAHIQAGHLERRTTPAEATLDTDTNAMQERQADLHGFSLLANTIPLAQGNIRVYIHTSIIFQTMAFLYRAVHFMHFRQDYGYLPPSVMRDLYFSPGDDVYPHPLTRLYSLRQGVRQHSSTTPDSLDHWDRAIDTFFENLWKPVCMKLVGAEQPVSTQWHHIVALHQLAYNAGDCGA